MLFIKISKKNILTGVLFFMLTGSALGKPFFKMNEQCLSAQSLIYQLRLDEAKKILLKEKSVSPENIAVPWLQEYCLFMSLFISENKNDYDRQQQEWKDYIRTAETLNTNDPWFRFILSDMYLHRASVRLKMDENISAGNDIKKANQLLRENETKFPAFLPDNKNTGLINVLFSAVPHQYQWLSNLLGFEGNLNAGMLKIESYLNSEQQGSEHQWLKLETAFVYALLQYNFQKNAEGAWKTIDKYTTGFKNNLLMNYMRATIAGYYGKNDDMITILSQKPHHPTLQPFYYMDYMLGLAKLRRLDNDADQYLKIYTVKFKGENYIKSAYRYLAWCSILKGDNPTATTYYSLCTKNGKQFQEEDKQAEKEAMESLRWTSQLLRGRLLFDGHYYHLALNELNSIDESKAVTLKFQLELNYRKARIYMETRDFPNAILLFDKVINLGKTESYYYAAYASLYMASIYEQLNNKTQARYYFLKAKDNFPENREYRITIEQKAKMGLKRVGE